MTEENKNEVVEEVEQEEVDTQESTEQPEEKTFTEKEVQQMIKDRLAREQKAKEKAVEEAEKLAKMNAEQKKEYEYEKMQEELSELKKERAYYSLSKEASKMLAEHDIQADDDLLTIVVKDDAEGTKGAVETFATLINKKVEQGVKKALSGKSPKVNAGSNAMTKENIMGIKDSTQRIKAIQENQHLFN